MPAAATILVVDDEVQMLRSVERLLRTAGFTVVTSTDPADALAQLASRPIDIVLADFHMKAAMTGVDFLLEVRARFPRVKRVMMTGSIAPTDFAKIASADVAAHVLEKPWPLGELQRLMAAIAAALDED